LQIGRAALKACMGIVALCWATGGIAASAGTAPPVVSHQADGAPTRLPSIQLLANQPGLAATCGGSAFDVNAFINVTAQSSADVKVSAPGVGTIEEFTDETGKNIGPYDAPYPTFHILPFGGGLAPNTLIKITITTYSGPSLSGSISFVSRLVFNCTTGAVAIAQPAPISSATVPALSPVGLATTAALLILVGAMVLRGSARRRHTRR
jgi:hypothetical protein